MPEPANPLALPVFTVSPGDLIPMNAANRADDLARITASMTARGWRGGPLIVDDRNFRDDDDGPGDGGYLLTGNHRASVAIALGVTEIPCASVTALAAAAGLDLAGYDHGDGVDWEAFFWDLPEEIRSAYGLDV
jgi:hypothetical protein